MCPFLARGSTTVRKGDDAVGNPHRAQMSQSELFELVLLLKSDKQFPVEQFEATVSQSIYIYIYRERERDTYTCIYIYIYIYMQIRIHGTRQKDLRFARIFVVTLAFEVCIAKCCKQQSKM